MQAPKLRDDAKLERRQDANAAHVAHVDVELPCLEAPPVVVRGGASARLDHRSCPDVAAQPTCSLARCEPAQGLVRAMVVEPNAIAREQRAKRSAAERYLDEPQVHRKIKRPRRRGRGVDVSRATAEAGRRPPRRRRDDGRRTAGAGRARKERRHFADGITRPPHDHRRRCRPVAHAEALSRPPSALRRSTVLVAHAQASSPPPPSALRRSTMLFQYGGPRLGLRSGASEGSPMPRR